MSDHTLTLAFDGEEIYPVFKCHAKPYPSGNPPACWTWTDEEGEFHVGERCGVTEWIENDGPYYLQSEITLDVEVDWDDDTPRVVITDPAKRIAELEAELARFKECEGEDYKFDGLDHRHHIRKVYHMEGE